MDDIARKVLVSAKDLLERMTKLETLPLDVMTEIHMSVTAMGYQLARSNYDPAKLEQVRAEERALSKQLSEDLGRRAPTPAKRKWQERWNAEPGAELTTVVAGARTETGGAKLAAGQERMVAERLKAFLVSYHEPLDPVISAGTRSTYQGGRGDKREEDTGGAIYITAPRLQEYLSRRSPGTDTRVLNVKRLMGGYSKETYIVKLAEEAGEKTIVIRKDGYGLPTGSSVTGEFDVLKQVYAFGLPVPEPLWLETDTRHFATAYMAVGFISGQAAHLNVPKDSGTQRKWSDSLAQTLALLHRSTSRPDTDVREVIRSDIADMQRRIEERERAPHPGLAFAMAWLVDHLGDLDGRPACRIHGDVGFHNLLMRDDRIIALLDWEFSHFSDPIEDLVYVKPFLDQIASWDHFLKTYQSAAEFKFDRQAARYFDVWKEVRNLVACLGSLNSLLLPQVKDVPLSVAGTIYIPKYEVAVLDAILQGA